LTQAAASNARKTFDCWSPGLVLGPLRVTRKRQAAAA
jgi:hypothetical protein